jgi:hypothetical protein
MGTCSACHVGCVEGVPTISECLAPHGREISESELSDSLLLPRAHNVPPNHNLGTQDEQAALLPFPPPKPVCIFFQQRSYALVLPVSASQTCFESGLPALRPFCRYL